MKIEAFIASLRLGLRSGIEKGSRSILYSKNNTILALLRAHSPKDSGEFSSNWRVARSRYGKRNILAGLVVVNDTPNYGQFVAFGAEPRKAPWYFPHGKSTGTGKLIQYQGKIWAGGLNPGHVDTVGGPIVQVMDSFANKFTQEFADKITGHIV